MICLHFIKHPDASDPNPLDWGLKRLRIEEKRF
jgi:hypothetical protein